MPLLGAPSPETMIPRTGAGGYVNQYTMGWDLFVPKPLGWTPLFNSAPDNGNDADFYVDDTGRLGIGALGYSPADALKAGQWHRVIFALVTA